MTTKDADVTEIGRAKPRTSSAPRKRAARPATPKQPSDHQKPAAQREAEGDPTVTIPYGGEKFVIPADQENWPILAVQAFAAMRNIDAIEHLLGPVQWARFVTFFPKRKQFNEFSDLIAVEFGFKSAGE